MWENPAAPFANGNLITLSQRGQRLAQVEFATGFHPLTGTDLTGEGHPEAVLEAFCPLLLRNLRLRPRPLAHQGLDKLDLNKCAVLPLVLDYLLTGRAGAAWRTLVKYYPSDGLGPFWAEIAQVLEPVIGSAPTPLPT